MHALIDLETMGHNSYAAIVAIGAVKFDPRANGYSTDDDFYMVVDLESSLAYGMVPDASTIKWWLAQSDEARKALLTEDAVDLGDALVEFQRWYKGTERFWCHGATFDAVILGNAFQLAKVAAPWGHRDVRDTRTLFELVGMEKTTVGGVEHHALDDAKRHALDVQEAYRRLQWDRVAG